MYIDKKIYKYLSAIFLWMSVGGLAGCTSDDITIPEGKEGDLELNFTGVIDQEEGLSTRAISYNDITTTYFNCDFFISVRGENGLGEKRERWSKFVIPSGYSGTLSLKTEEERTYPKLNWFSRDHDHYFNGWTAPWTSELDPSTEGLPEEITVPFPGSSISETTQSTNGSSVSWNSGSWKNGEVMEKFIAADNGPIDYISNGQFVELKFRHMVSKIFISNFAVVDNVTGTTSTNLRGEITFYGLPSEVPFYPNPTDEQGRPGKPFIPKPEDYGWNYDQSDGVTYAVTNNLQYYNFQGGQVQARDCFYIPPEIDLSRLSFKIQIYEYVNKNWVYSTVHGLHGAFYGDFSRIQLSRTTNGTNHDNFPYDGDDLTRLHADEYLLLNINLYEKGEPTIRGTITNWRSWVNRDASQHVEEGIYSFEELKEFSDLMSSTGMNEEKQRRRDEFHKNHGGLTTQNDTPGQYPDYPEEKKVIKIYDDIGSSNAHNSTTDSNGSNKMGSYLYVDSDYILDGQGHTINVNSSTLYIGQVRDVYFRYYYYNTSSTPYKYTEYIIYIDKMGNVYTVNPETFEETPTGQNVNDMTRNPFTLSMSSGKIS